jgi:putative sterol carrier protein
MPTVSEIFRNMPQRLDSDKAKELDLAIQFDLAGDDGGLWHAVVKGGAVDMGQGEIANPAATIRMSSADFVAMTSGELSAVNAFMMGKVKVEGDLNAVMKFQSVFGM